MRIRTAAPKTPMQALPRPAAASVAPAVSEGFPELRCALARRPAALARAEEARRVGKVLPRGRTQLRTERESRPGGLAFPPGGHCISAAFATIHSLRSSIRPRRARPG